jgi:hypothetical protein
MQKIHRLVICEKTSQAAVYAKALNVTAKKDGYYEGKVWVDGLVSAKTGKVFSAMGVLDDTGKYVNLGFDFTQKKPK